MSDPTAIERARVALAASTKTPDPVLRTHHVAAARLAFTRATEELREVEALLIARERELARIVAPRQTLLADVPDTRA